FVSYLKIFFPDPVYTEKSMGFMGMGEILFSILAAILLKNRSTRSMLIFSFAGCAASALLTLVQPSAPLLYVSALLIGSFTGMLTVTLASGLRDWITGPHFGLQVGIGTGLAYLLCNIPAVFDASPFTQTIFSAVICLIGMTAVLTTSARKGQDPTGIPTLPSSEFRGIGLTAVILIFLALVWLDSTAFATIQLNESLRAHTWGSPSRKLMLGLFHASAAILAGWFIDRRSMRGLLAATFALFALSFTLLQSNGIIPWLAGPLYAIGISIYSTCLVAFPSLHPERPGLVPIRWRAAVLYAVAGWFGSGLGVGLAQHLHSIPGTLLLGAGLLVATGLWLPQTPARRRISTRYWPLLLTGIAGCVYFTLTPNPDIAPTAEPSVALGREVYKQEGCINCHSQYLRPNHPRDLLLWGPYRAIDRDERPPMVGNRRQGPDLMNAGLRRTALWHRQHLIDPSSLSPGSKIPSYAYLFDQDDPRGPSLVLYLSSLGLAGAEARMHTIETWTPEPDRNNPSYDNGKRIFQRFCSPCHGYAGNGDGPLAHLFDRPAMKLTKGAFFYVPSALDEQSETIALARIVKFGLPGLNMPGHEVFNDQEIVDVVTYVRQLAQTGPDSP
ncbi:MAG: cbb3-type cytochrome c oxidase subunit II, partial [Kiritimatiellae bacterium]|nr:cbb3-type cytochrome c oxidase subunit II [Kiritimatiellia bacterium]